MLENTSQQIACDFDALECPIAGVQHHSVWLGLYAGTLVTMEIGVLISTSPLVYEVPPRRQISRSR